MGVAASSLKFKMMEFTSIFSEAQTVFGPHSLPVLAVIPGYSGIFFFAASIFFAFRNISA